MITDYLKERQAQVDRAIEQLLPAKDVRPALLHEAMRYSVLNGGKRIRPILAIAAAEALGKTAEDVIKPAVSVELYHCSTLIHDDLPCMDDDDLRRGQPTCHIQYGEANAVLAGDALMIMAFELLAEFGNAQLGLELARAAGSRGVIAGQVEDLAAEGKAPNADLVEFIHLNKTAILIQASVRMGAIAAGANEKELDRLSRFGRKIGLAFQIADDILDETSSDDVLGKPTGSDTEQHKMTYPAVHGMDAAQTRVRALTFDAIAALMDLNRDTSALKSIAEFLMNRTF
ncbi:polyprenyl synthetase family protein [Pontiella agarivorans]|uniref:Polyprenyl synthetase family protein n=1 Tax=Pontiella agarivorans TaxID=3038953 RepID=A0ABU5MUI2_9BACT|nr:farnesyl diphosphate synthase [Pontiella agarivorans]MDZ8117875.1 polyprenyl synthetase family protein [Pontiella agarivorans]